MKLLNTVNNNQTVITPELDFEVRKVKLIHNGVETGKFAMDRHTLDGQFIDTVGIVGGNYLDPNHREYLQTIANFVDKMTNGQWSVSHRINQRSTIGLKIFTTFTLKSDRYLIQKPNSPNENAYTQITVTTSFDGSTAFQVAFLIYRLICSNGMMALSKESLIVNKHFHNFRLNDALSKVPKMIDSHKQVYGNFMNKAIDMPKLAKETIERKLKNKPVPTIIVDSAIKQAVHEQDNLWGQYNAFTFHISRAEIIEEKRKEQLRIVTGMFQNAVGMKV